MLGEAAGRRRHCSRVQHSCDSLAGAAHMTTSRSAAGSQRRRDLQLCYITSSLTLAVCLVGLCTVAAGDPGGPNWSPEQPQQLLDCMNEGMTFQRTSWNKSVLNDELPHLRLYQLLWSRRPPRFNLTVFTQLTLDRMSALVHQCQTFTGPISAALYMPLVQYKAQGVTTLSTRNKARLESAAKKLATFHAEAERNHAGCQMDLMLWYEVFDSVDSLLLYPVNALRNFARMQVRTKLLAAIDVDMLISMTLSEQLVKPRILEFYETHALKRRVTVLPAFEPTRNGPLGRALANQLSQVSKAKLQRMHDKMPASVQQFKLQVFPRGHTATNYRKWFRTKDLYPVAYKRFFEPWFITHWDVMPWFDINFKGYGKNKIVHVASMTFYNHSFWIHPEAWLVHQPHEDSRVRTLVSRQAANVHGQGMKLPKHSLYTKVTDLFAKAKKAMIKGTFEAAVDPQMMKCFKKLPWLQKPPALKGYPVKAELLN